MRKCPAVITEEPSCGWLSWVRSGRLLRIASTSVTTVAKSSRVRRCGGRIFRNVPFMWCTPASHKPPKCGARAGEKCYSTGCRDESSITLSWKSDVCSSRKQSASSFAAPWKFVPLSV